MLVSPLAATAGAILLLTIGTFAGSRLHRGARVDAPAVASLPATAQLVSFVFFSTDARSVVLVGDFNGWRPDATPLVRSGGNGTWSAVVPLSPGRYTYSFLVDGVEWASDPLAAPAPEEGYGRPSSVLFVEEAS
jgi:1,4-alpha-glucan branching enzyme